MNILVIAANDSDNLMISNVLFELQRRGHKLQIYSHFTDEKSVRMFRELGVPVHHVKDLTNASIDWADSIISALRAHINLKALGEKVFCSKYIYIYNNYIDSHWATAGGDFMFTCGTTRQPLHPEDCPSMPIGCPKNDHISSAPSTDDSKTILFIDSGHYPFSHKGKIQVADMLLDICKAYPEYELMVKPRFLPKDENMLHSNRDHLYSCIEDRCEGDLPSNLVLLQEHRDMQELLDQCCCAVMLCSSAYVDAALRGKNILIVKGIDNEDKYELRNEIEYKNIYQLREESGCVVDYRDVVRHLPHGIKCSEEHLNKLVAYRENASQRMVDVMEFIYDNFLSKGEFPAIQNYNYETYCSEMKADPSLTWDIIKHKRLKNMGNNSTNFFNRITAQIDYTAFYEALDNSYMSYPASVEGATNFLKQLDSIRCALWIENANLMMADPMNQAELIRVLYDAGKHDKILELPENQILCPGPYNYYLGLIFHQRKDWLRSTPHITLFLKEASKRYFAKYPCEESWGIRTAYQCIAEMYAKSNISCEDFAELYEILYHRYQARNIPYRSLKRLHMAIPKVCDGFYGQGEYKRAAECALLYIHQISKFNDDKRRASELQKEIVAINSSWTYRIGRAITWLPRKVRGGIRCVCENGWKYTYNRIIEKLKAPLKRNPLYRIFCEFNANIYSGYHLYSGLIGEFGENTYVELSAGGTGNIYICGRYYNKYISSKGRKDTAVYILPGEKYYQTAKLFKLDRAKAISRADWTKLLNLLRFIGESNIPMEALHYHLSAIYTGFLTCLESLHGWNMYSMIHEVHFCNLGIDDIERPTFLCDSSEINGIFCENNLSFGKTVVLAPYAGLAPRISSVFWDKLVFRLVTQGFTVCTNSSCSAEPPIRGTVPVLYPHNLSVPFLEAAGYIVGLRSGFLDIIESARCKKVALYPHNFEKRGIANGSAIGSFSLNAMFNRNDFLELETTPENLDEIVESILNYFVSE